MKLWILFLVQLTWGILVSNAFGSKFQLFGYFCWVMLISSIKQWHRAFQCTLVLLQKKKEAFFSLCWVCVQAAEIWRISAALHITATDATKQDKSLQRLGEVSRGKKSKVKTKNILEQSHVHRIVKSHLTTPPPPRDKHYIDFILLFALPSKRKAREALKNKWMPLKYWSELSFLFKYKRLSLIDFWMSLTLRTHFLLNLKTWHLMPQI